jgi:transposase
VRTGRSKQPLTVLPADQEKLELLARRPKTAQRMALRSKIVLRAAQGLANQEIARQLDVTGTTVGKWRERYRIRGMEGLGDDPRPGTPRKITDTQVEAAVTQTLEHTLAGQESRTQPERGGAHLAHLRSPASS